MFPCSYTLQVPDATASGVQEEEEGGEKQAEDSLSKAIAH